MGTGDRRRPGVALAGRPRVRELVDRPLERPLALAGWTGVVVGLGAMAGGPGVVVALAAAAGWLLMPAPYAVALGAVLTAAVSDPPVPGAVPLALVVIGLGSVLLDSIARHESPGTAALALMTALAGTGTAALAGSFAGGALRTTAVVLVAAGATLAYGVHRYERVSVGLVEDES